MKTGFRDATAPKGQNPKDKPEDGRNSPWDFTCPQYDQRTSSFINAGTDYGIGHRQPVGSESHSDKNGVPFGRVNTMKVDRT